MKLDNLYHLNKDIRHPKPKMPPSPFWQPPDEEGREYGTPLCDAVVTAIIVAFLAGVAGLGVLIWRVL